jgi:hypothetical protein
VIKKLDTLSDQSDHAISGCSQDRVSGVGKWLAAVESRGISDLEFTPLFQEALSPLVGELIQCPKQSLQVGDGRSDAEVTALERLEPSFHQPKLT